jgi:hypothetical protein
MKSRKIVVFLSDDLASWLDAKASEGYKWSITEENIDEVKLLNLTTQFILW